MTQNQFDCRTALIIVDMQGCFMDDGELPVPGARQLASTIAAIAREAQQYGALIVKTRDFHPADHCSFAAQGGPWPAHGVQGTAGAELHPVIAGLDGLLVDKGTDPTFEAYSGFNGTGLADLLRGRGITRVVVVGVATEYCDKATALDAQAEGFDVLLLTDGVLPVDVNPGDGAKALDEMRQAGVTVI